jgi:CBS domain-containing protein
MTTVADVMTRDIFALSPDTSLETAARLFAQRHITGAPVVNAEGRTIGVVTLADLTDPDRDRGNKEGYPLYYQVTDGWAAILGDATDVADGRVDEVMTHSVITTDASASIQHAAQLMLRSSIHRLLVTENEELVGIVSTTDLLRGFVDAASKAAKAS